MFFFLKRLTLTKFEVKPQTCCLIIPHPIYLVWAPARAKSFGARPQDGAQGVGRLPDEEQPWADGDQLLADLESGDSHLDAGTK